MIANRDWEISRLEAADAGNAERLTVVKACAALEGPHMLRLSTGNGAGETCPGRILKHAESRHGVAMTSRGA